MEALLLEHLLHISSGFHHPHWAPCCWSQASAGVGAYEFGAGEQPRERFGRQSQWCLLTVRARIQLLPLQKVVRTFPVMYWKLWEKDIASVHSVLLAASQAGSTWGLGHLYHGSCWLVGCKGERQEGMDRSWDPTFPHLFVAFFPPPSWMKTRHLGTQRVGWCYQMVKKVFWVNRGKSTFENCCSNYSMYCRHTHTHICFFFF